MSVREPSKRLGLGLAALMGDSSRPRTLQVPSAITTLPVEALEPGPYQPRRVMDEASLLDLADSIRMRGILQPILARPDPTNPARYQIIAGERRWRAAQQAGLHEVPVHIRAMSDTDAMAAGLVENLQREDLNAIEEAEGYRRLTAEFGLTQERLAEAIGKSRSHIANMVRLLNLPDTVQQEVKTGRLTAGHARALLTHAEPEKAAQLIITRGLNVRQAEALTTNSARSGGEITTRQAKDPETQALERDLSDRLGLKVGIAFDGKGGTIRIHYRSRDQLDGLLALLNPN